MTCLECYQSGFWWEERDAEKRGSVFKLKHPDHLWVCVCVVSSELGSSTILPPVCVHLEPSPCRLLDDLSHCPVVILTHLRGRSRSLFSSYKPGRCIQAIKDWGDDMDSTNPWIKPWSSMMVTIFLNLTCLCLPDTLVFVLRILLQSLNTNHRFKTVCLNKSWLNLLHFWLKCSEYWNSEYRLKMISNICQDLCRDISDVYAEYEEEEVQEQLPGSPHLLLSPGKHLNLNINVGGTVSSFTRSPDFHLENLY